MEKTAILVDGGFYRRRARHLWGEKTAEERAKELQRYCLSHSHDKYQTMDIYRIFYYDCPPQKISLYNPIERKNMDLGGTATFRWMTEFLDELSRTRKFALRLGELSTGFSGYHFTVQATKELMSGKRTLDEVTTSDLKLSIQQKGVDMKIGIDIASLAYKKQVSQIVLISGDSDFVPAAKLARREGIDFILDPMGQTIKQSLHEHIDGLRDRSKSYRK